jgi:predicted nucleotidyltransferase
MDLTAEVLQSFVRDLREFFGDRLVSIVLYGSIVLDDLAPGYGDLDFLAVVDDDLSDEDLAGLVELRKPLRSADSSIYAKMLEGAFLPRKMLDPAVKGKAFWWGTSGERPRETNQLGPLVLHLIRERGLVIWGEDIRPEIPPPSRDEMVSEVRAFAEGMDSHGAGGGLHSIDWLLTTARLLLWLREDRLSSKTEAADWGRLNAEGAWRECLPISKQIRLNPALADSPETKAWLEGLCGPIREACAELERELADILNHR